MAMSRVVVAGSSNIRAIGYDPDTKVLEIEFSSGTYEYLEVPESVYFGLSVSESKGSYFSSMIRPIYKWRKKATGEDQNKAGGR